MTQWGEWGRAGINLSWTQQMGRWVDGWKNRWERAKQRDPANILTVNRCRYDDPNPLPLPPTIESHLSPFIFPLTTPYSLDRIHNCSLILLCILSAPLNLKWTGINKYASRWQVEKEEKKSDWEWEKINISPLHPPLWRVVVKRTMIWAPQIKFHPSQLWGGSRNLRWTRLNKTKLIDALILFHG